MKKGVITDYGWRKRRIILWIFIILFILMIPTFLTMIYVFRHIKYKGVEDENHPYQAVYKSEDFKLSSTQRNIKTEDGEVLWCSEVETNDPKAVVIFLTAMRQPSVTYFYGHASLMKDLGYASFLLETRAHGESTGRKLGLGYLEVDDVRALVNYIGTVEKYKNLPIVVWGVSLGGSAAINCTAEIPEVSGCIAMSPFSSVDDQLDQILKSYHIPGFLRAAQRPFTHQSLRWIYGKDKADNLTPVSSIQRTGSKPVLIIASLHDEETSIENSYILQKTPNNAEFWFRDSYDHYVIKNNDFKGVAADKEYCNYIEGFIKKIIDSKKAK
ncbi:MAG: alpha/beta hydrolase [Lachnospiraceae bacterium]|jgi:pimeloyl-ACP methyl ester carboxylesterase|nr:alpha/beta hydrolase [Lachnospiraceae bacterium]MBP5670487.1 alpha/beta hydrolase [Lachnospiraceae bacterium]MBR3470920.1 alpha/beta hydrolase [Lachnospiraceae bacterium]MCR5501328.1 alpha/beta hydrolase [Acetatifactor sp.]